MMLAGIEHKPEHPDEDHLTFTQKSFRELLETAWLVIRMMLGGRGLVYE
jgi:hypothetical protein